MALLLVIPLSAVLIGIDQWSKMWADANLALNGPSVEWIPGIMNYQLHHNDGIGWSLLSGEYWIFIPLSILIALLFVVVLLRSPLRKHVWFDLICAFILSGAIGNLIDRISCGEVTDFLEFAFVEFPIFNVADCYVVVGAIALFIAILFGAKKIEDVPLRTLLFGIQVKEKEQNDG